MSESKVYGHMNQYHLEKKAQSIYHCILTLNILFIKSMNALDKEKVTCLLFAY